MNFKTVLQKHKEKIEMDNKDKTQSGFNINLGNECSKNAYFWAKSTFKNRKDKSGEPRLDVDGMFSNLLDFNGTKIGITSDGIGTKIEIAERTGVYDTLGYDLIAMVVDDLVAGGFEPTNLSNILDVDYLNYNTINSLMRGLHDASNETKIAVTGGEIAELGKRVGGYGDGMHFNWSSTGIGILHEKLKSPIDGTKIKPGDVVLSLRSRGFRSNGFSLIRKIMRENLGDEWHNAEYSSGKTWGGMLIAPSLIYSPVICDVLSEGFKIKGIAHITGGGIKDNFRRVLKASGCGAVIDNLFEPLEVMKRVRNLGKISNEKAYLYWNMGNGMLLVVNNNEWSDIVEFVHSKDYEVKKAGEITTYKNINVKYID
jgi:phosphoribosylformylglycinamidine cyclo-ligase